MPLVERFGVQVARHGVNYQHHVYAGVGHGFLEGLVKEHDASEAAHDAWAKTLTLLSKI